MKRSLIADTTARLIFHSALVLSLYFLFAGHNQPGGGFVGGLVFGAAIAVYYVAGGIDDVRAVSRLAPWSVLSIGLILASGATLAPLAAGGAPLESGVLTVDAGFLGEVKASTTLVFDAGVYAIVVGLVLMVFEAFGEEAAQEDSHREQATG